MQLDDDGYSAIGLASGLFASAKHFGGVSFWTPARGDSTWDEVLRIDLRSGEMIRDLAISHGGDAVALVTGDDDTGLRLWSKNVIEQAFASGIDRAAGELG